MFDNISIPFLYCCSTSRTTLSSSSSLRTYSLALVSFTLGLSIEGTRWKTWDRVSSYGITFYESTVIVRNNEVVQGVIWNSIHKCSLQDWNDTKNITIAQCLRVGKNKFPLCYKIPLMEGKFFKLQQETYVAEIYTWCKNNI